VSKGVILVSAASVHPCLGTATQSSSQRIRDEQRRASSGSFKGLQGATGPEHRVNVARNHRGDQELLEIPKATNGDIKATFSLSCRTVTFI